MNRFRNLLTPAVAVAICAGALGVQAAPLEVRIGWVVTPGGLQPLLFNDGYRNSDILKHYGKSYTVKALKFRGSTPQITALAAGELNIAQLSFSSFAIAIENAKLHDIRVIADIFQDGYGDYLTQHFMVRGDSSIRTIADLKGKKLGVNAFGGANDIAMRTMLRRHGLKLNRDYTGIEVRFGSMVPFLGEAKIDLIGMGMPFRVMAERAYKARSLFSVKDAVGVSQLVLLTAQTGFIQKNRSALNDFFEDYVRGLHWWFDPANREQAVKLIAKFNKRPVKAYADWVLTEKDYYRHPYAFPNLEALQKNIDGQREMGFLKDRIDAKKYSDLSLVMEAKRRLDTGKLPAGWR